MIDHNEYIVKKAEEVLLYVAQPKFYDEGIKYSEVVRELDILPTTKSEILSLLFDEKRYFRARPATDPILFITMIGKDAADILTERYLLEGKTLPHINSRKMTIDETCSVIIDLHKKNGDTLYWSKQTFLDLNLQDPYSGRARLLDAGFITERQQAERRTDISFDYKDCKTYEEMVQLREKKISQVPKQINVSGSATVIDQSWSSISGSNVLNFNKHTEEEKKNWGPIRKSWEYCSNNKLIVSIVMGVLGFFARDLYCWVIFLIKGPH